REAERRHPPDCAVTFGIGKVARSGVPELCADVPEEVLAASERDMGQVPLLRQLGLKSYLIMPLRVGERTLGTLTFASGDPALRSSADDLPFAEDLARRAALAVDNALLYRQLQDADRRKENFLAMLGHELRNTLVPIRNALHLLHLREKDAQSVQWSWDVVRRQ